MPVFERNSAPPAFAGPPPAVTGPQENHPIARLTRPGIWFAALALVAMVVTAAIAWRAVRRPVAAPALLLPLASYPGEEGRPTLSPDGTLVAFAWSRPDEPGVTDIYVKAIGSEALRRLTETPGSEGSPAWSPDEQTIAFFRAGEGVFTISQLGGAERRVSASGTQVAWAGDSKSVLIRDRDGEVGPFGIYQVVLETLERRRLTSLRSARGIGGLKSHRTARPWRSYGMSVRASRTCMSCRCGEASRGGSRTGTER